MKTSTELLIIALIFLIMFLVSISIHSNLDDPIGTEVRCTDNSGNEIVDSKCIDYLDDSREMLKLMIFASIGFFVAFLMIGVDYKFKEMSED